LAKSLQFWQKLDFAPVLNADQPYPWALLSDGVMTIGLHQTLTFTHAALTYFAEDPHEQIMLLKSKSVQLAHELKNSTGDVEGAILQAPDGQSFFLLKGAV
jgi:hypothetical protein